MVITIAADPGDHDQDPKNMTPKSVDDNLRVLHAKICQMLRERISNDATSCTDLSQATDEPQPICFYGTTGDGKSTRSLASKYASWYIKSQTDTIVSVILVQVPNPDTFKTAVAEILQSLDGRTQ